MTAPRTQHPFIRFQLPALVWAVTIFIASSIPAHSIPNFAIFSQDKLLHFLVYFIFTSLVYIALIHQSRFPALSGRPLLWSIFIAAIYGALDEFHQSFTGRSADVLDLLADVAGASFLVAIVLVVRRMRRARAR
jgi:VanZ family protein